MTLVLWNKTLQDLLLLENDQLRDGNCNTVWVFSYDHTPLYFIHYFSSNCCLLTLRKLTRIEFH